LRKGLAGSGKSPRVDPPRTPGCHGTAAKPAEIEAFLQDNAANAYERIVDRYLASPLRRTSATLLAGRRALATRTGSVDNYREIWPYRDWVIAA
jgi:hypothetical protein